MIEQIETVNFRNLQNKPVKFAKGLNIFFGDNAQGKTNLLEAIYLLSSGKSFKAESDREIITWGEKEAKLVGNANPLKIELVVGETAKKLSVNGSPKRLIDLIGEFNVVLFAPEDLNLINGPPAGRRVWLNSLISRLDRKYLFNLARLNQVVKNRNKLLFRINQGHNEDLHFWDEQLMGLAVVVWLARKEHLAQTNQTLKNLAPKLSVNKIYLEYHPQIDFSEKKDLEANFRQKLERLKSEEVRKAQSLIGPHRDDFKIVFEQFVGDRLVASDVAVFGSRGEQRTAVLSLKLAEIELLEKVKNERPTLLLDDVLSEFDQTHREMIQKLLYQQQSFVTTTALELLSQKLLPKAAKFKIQKGEVNQI